MIKKIILLFIFCSVLLSCGKKADPEYNAKKNDVLISKV